MALVNKRGLPKKLSNAEDAAAGVGKAGATMETMEAEDALADIEADPKIRQTCRVKPTQICRPLRELYSEESAAETANENFAASSC